MIVFSHNIIFEDIPEFEDEIYDSSRNTIKVSHRQEYPLAKYLPLRSDIAEMSGQRTRYHSTVPFHKKADGSFSWALEVIGVLTLVWDHSMQKIYYIQGVEYTSERLRFWLFHTFFPMVLEMERIYRILHVGSVEIAGRPVLFSAFSFGGKSTLTDYFIRRGHTLISDDTMAVDKREDGYYAISSYPFHRPYREPESLGYPASNFAIDPKPLHAAYLLDRSSPDTVVEIAELTGIEKFKAFHYTPYIDFDFTRQERFVYFGEMARWLSIYRITVPWDLERLEEVYDAIVAQVGDSTAKS